MKPTLFLEAIGKFLTGLILVALLLFLSAGSLAYFNAWLFIVLLFVPMFLAGVIMLIKNPTLLQKRLQAKENQKEQDFIIKCSALMFLLGFIVAGLGFRFKWFTLPRGIVLGAVILFLLSYLLYAEVLRENIYLSRTIEVSENQKVIDTGLYAFVRHPMYTATLFLFLSMPLILGSLYAFLIFLVYPVLIILRLQKEEEYLEKNLIGYSAYKQKVKYRLIPFIY